MKPLLILVSLLVLLAGVVSLWTLGSRGPDAMPGPSVDALLDFDFGAEGFTEVVADRPVRFPADHGAHPDYRGELWNLFGQLNDTQGGRYDFQFSLTRVALAANPPVRASEWAANAIYRGRLTLTRAGEPGVRSAERLTRAALGLAGAGSQPISVWIEDWSLSHPDGQPELPRMRLVADGEGPALTLDLIAGKPPIPFADLGLLGGDVGGLGLQAYLLPRMAATGTVTLDGEPRSVEGQVWLDHAWGTLPSGGGQVGLNRFAIQLDRDRELVCVQLRREDGTGTRIPACALILADGQVQSFRRREIRLEPFERWLSPGTGARYPVAWRLSIPILDLELELVPLTRDQEADDAVRIWSGAVQAVGRLGGDTIAGHGRIETTAEAVAPSGT
ncbi:lipocalin-like domain-containing protein [Thiocapsa roseopersicina]|uniref:Predicted secreted hydrolase n=1 Tax=Thiocapsa roseopersicina TaxID=1058 RepID=A0A1H2SZ42_THIRO|nr:lipocalin-like domain-containing protein [Thiocapsa roseopersicina]SDW36868.1 Predicted secreted hydrolase [Thiocapsa roseopersicina]